MLSKRDITLSKSDTALFKRDTTLFKRDTTLSKRDISLSKRDTVVSKRDTVQHRYPVGSQQHYSTRSQQRRALALSSAHSHIGHRSTLVALMQ